MKEKKFENQGGIQSYIDLLRQHKEYNPQHETYEIIKCYDTGGDTFAIQKLQKKTEEQPKVKKIISTKKDD